MEITRFFHSLSQTLAMSSFCLHGLDSHAEGGWLHPHPPPSLPVEEEPLTLSLSSTVGVGSQSCRQMLGLTQKAQASPFPFLPTTTANWVWQGYVLNVTDVCQQQAGA